MADQQEMSVAEAVEPPQERMAARPSKEIYIAASVCSASSILVAVGITLLSVDAVNSGTTSPAALTILLLGIIALIASAWRTYVVWQRRTSTRRQVSEAYRLEEQRWKEFIKQKDNEVRKAGEVASRLRGSLRSLSLERQSLRSASKLQQVGTDISLESGSRGRSLKRIEGDQELAQRNGLTTSTCDSQKAPTYESPFDAQGTIILPGLTEGNLKSNDDISKLRDDQMNGFEAHDYNKDKVEARPNHPESAYQSTYGSTVEMPNYRRPSWLAETQGKKDNILNLSDSAGASLNGRPQRSFHDFQARQAMQTLRREASSGLLSVASSLGAPPNTVRGGLYAHPSIYSQSDAIDVHQRDSRTWHGETVELPLGRPSGEQSKVESSKPGSFSRLGEPESQVSHRRDREVAGQSVPDTILPHDTRLQQSSIVHNAQSITRQSSTWTHHLDIDAAKSVASCSLTDGKSQRSSMTPAPLFSRSQAPPVPISRHKMNSVPNPVANRSNYEVSGTTVKYPIRSSSLSNPFSSNHCVQNPIFQTSGPTVAQTEHNAVEDNHRNNDESLADFDSGGENMDIAFSRRGHGYVEEMQSDDNAACNGAVPSDAGSTIPPLKKHVGEWVKEHASPPADEAIIHDSALKNVIGDLQNREDETLKQMRAANKILISDSNGKARAVLGMGNGAGTLYSDHYSYGRANSETPLSPTQAIAQRFGWGSGRGSLDPVYRFSYDVGGAVSNQRRSSTGAGAGSGPEEEANLGSAVTAAAGEGLDAHSRNLGE